MVDFSIQALAAVAYHGLGWLEFREDLGECKHGVPASVWNWPSLTELAKVGYLRGALYQREWSSINFRKPTGILSNIAGFMSDPDLHPGWPAFSSHQKDDSGRKYQGPLPHQCLHAVHYFDLLGTTSDGDFHTFSSAANHTSMCSKLAGYFVEALVMKFSGKIRGISPLVGAFSGVSNLSPIDLHFSQVSSLSLDADHILGHSGFISLGLHELLEPDGSSRLAMGGDMGILKRFNAIVLDVVLRSGRSFVWTSFQLQKMWHSSPTSMRVSALQYCSLGVNFRGASSCKIARCLSRIPPSSLNLTKPTVRNVIMETASPLWLTCIRS